jgi:chaperonin GroEL
MDEPLKQICKNAGVEYMSVLNRMVQSDTLDIGYNAKTDTVEDLVKSGIIDPVKVLRCALQNAASSAGMILTSEVLIVDYLN